ncbi:hypothetical protein [Arthrobacter methylotrophus]|uniref:Lipoprotein n=2 Tax=Arthrobacter methylotrophus TaxID=121291 RepID=A0ABV5UNW4_9MICC
MSIAIPVAALLGLTGCTPTMTTAQACSEYNVAVQLLIDSSNDPDLHHKYEDQLKGVVDKAPDSVKADMNSIYLLFSKSPDAKDNPEAAKRIQVACQAAK